ncbi:FAD binding domain-containing protein [Metabacillus bambusae]|uniref:FAD binding domain-containing protein n=1 Tax=Metabacillus bambusae TaxID=2795218 RepID=A0ABS3N1E8_9BACI|nr:FAD binding domain-containing protein [Metabacillus bambusae]MBO1512088.1 FAD binding domain-containing protein [Metabacillus bambusae]
MITVKNEMAAITKSDILVEHPRLIQDAMRLRELGGVFIAGGTLIQLNWEAGLPLSTTLINVASITELKEIMYIERGDRSFVEIGTLTTISECLENPIINEHVPLLIAACKKVAAPAVRNRATLGGNVASGIGDSIPALLVLDAELTIRIQDKTKVIKLWELLRLQRDSPKLNFLLLFISIPCQKKEDQAIFKKVGRREAFTPALVTICAQWRRISAKRLEYIRIAVGGGNNDPCRLIVVEKILETNDFDENLLRSLYLEIIDEINSYSDPFITETYRKQVAANLLVAELMNIFCGKEG